MKTAIPIIVAGLLLMLLGIGQQTLWAPEETATASVLENPGAAPVTVLRPQVIGDAGDSLELTVEADGPFTLAVGRSADVMAWIDGAAHVSVTGRSEDSLSVERTDGEDTVPDPRGSDLWVVEEPGDGALTYRWSAPAEGDWSILLAADGVAPAPTQLSVVVPNDSSTPFALPLIIGGALVVLLGIVLLFLRPRSTPRRRRGGRAEAPEGTRAHARQHPEAHTSRRSASYPVGPTSVLLTAGLVTTAVVGAGALVTATPGMATTSPAPSGTASPTASSAPSQSASDTSSATATSTASPPVATGAPSAGSAASGPPVLLDTQLARILRAVSATVEEADAAADEELLTERVSGAARELRVGAYAVGAEDDDAAPLPPVAVAPLLLDMIPTNEGWPRSVVALTQGEEDPVPQALLLRQESPRQNYVLVSAIQMLPGSTFPSPPTAGATGPISLDGAGALSAAPQDAVTAIADYLTTPDGAQARTFEDNSFSDAIIDFQAEVVKNPGNDAATITFTHTADPERTEALLTGDGGAMVFGYLDHTYSSVPRSSSDTIDLTGTVYQALTGQDSSEDGIDVNYGEAVMMYVPPAGSNARIRVVGAAQQLLSATLR